VVSPGVVSQDEHHASTILVAASLIRLVLDVGSPRSEIRPNRPNRLPPS
jgi:hypothetical protein